MYKSVSQVVPQLKAHRSLWKNVLLAAIKDTLQVHGCHAGDSIAKRQKYYNHEYAKRYFTKTNKDLKYICDFANYDIEKVVDSVNFMIENKLSLKHFFNNSCV